MYSYSSADSRQNCTSALSSSVADYRPARCVLYVTAGPLSARLEYVPGGARVAARLLALPQRLPLLRHAARVRTHRSYEYAASCHSRLDSGAAREPDAYAAAVRRARQRVRTRA